MEEKIKEIIKVLKQFRPQDDYGDLVWEFYLPIKGKWRQFGVKEYNKVFYFFCSDMEMFSTDKKLELDSGQKTLVDNLLPELKRIYLEVKKSSINYHTKLDKMIPKKLRKGIISRALVDEIIPGFSYFLHDELKVAEVKQMKQFLKVRYSSELVENMTANLFFKYCKVAYAANGTKSHPGFENQISGRDLYKRLADGRDGGLLKLPADSTKAFLAWLQSSEKNGSHPWEIYRGGNSTHISLAVSWEEYYKKFKVHLSAFSSSRLSETCRIALAFDKAKLAFNLSNSDSYRFRLYQEDYIGVVPEGHPIKYAWQSFPETFNVCDCLHLYDFKDEQGRKFLAPVAKIHQLISWFPLPVVRLK